MNEPAFKFEAFCLAPAKINLALHVTGQRNDGYHLLESLVCFSRFGDRLRISTADQDNIEIEGPLSESLRGQTQDRNNLLISTLAALRKIYPVPPVRIVLDKHIPIAAGLGGGSSDAAALMRLIGQGIPQILSQKDMAQLALNLGADVPMCLESQPLIARGIGETLQVIPDFPVLNMVLINPRIGVATPDIFANLTRKDNAPLPNLPPKVTHENLIPWLEATRNDLEPPAIKQLPLIATIKETLSDHGAILARMSGSGASVFGLFETVIDANQAAMKIQDENPNWFVLATQTMPSFNGTQIAG